MERRKCFVWHKLFWAAAILQLAMFTTALNVTTELPPESEPVSGYTWSAWGSWSACSMSCGGGVAVQERQCLPRSRSTAANITIPPPLSSPLPPPLPPPVITVRVTRQTRDCLGVARRYHECNTAPCSKGETDLRAEQCAVYDRRPFRGRFYTWVPYIDGDSPCTLNCRPLGQQFYASLALVADGTPCTKPGYRAICVQGTCKIVGRETIIAAANAREVRCGRRLVSGLFSRPRLPLGYSYVTTVPRGACRLNVSEIVPSDNYIALKISNSSYIVNGEFAVSAPGTYDAAGARFVYSRVAGLDNIFAMGPILQPVDIMVLYTQPNPSIRYEYFTESLSNEGEIEISTRPNIPEILPSIATKHIRRHHTFETFPRPSVSRFPDLVSMSKEVGNNDDVEENVVGSRKFIWKITSYSQCTRSCGGGIQLGKYRCVEISTNGSDKEVSPVHCPGSSPVGRRRRCNNAPCPPRWRAAAWSACPYCGPASRTRIVGCVQDHFRGITKVSDQKCPSPKPITSEVCNIPNCDGSEQIGVRGVRTQEHTDTFRDGPVYSVAVNSTDFDVGPEYSFGATAGWLYTDWSECVGWCVGGGVQTRGIRCADPSGCTPKKAPESSRNCTPKLTCEPHDGRWFTGEWSPCSSSCGGKQIRGVLCIGGSGRHLRDTACKGTKPEQERSCGGDCAPTWYSGEWEQCTGNCTNGVGAQRRSVVCLKDSNGAGSDADCPGPKPASVRACEPDCNSDVPPEISLEPEIAPVITTSLPTTPRIVQTTPRVIHTTSFTTTVKSPPKECKDKLSNCALAVQARLCHYNYYVQNCCYSCIGR
ncbi:thrombospondin type-1 domain-containing protein 4-like [Ostrinia furnacalis]|uniref:thrombospondin type-1 domain-containing protein 4-like n=1 Tax=Ostrinia furnacalis TaxID=93504 RepID=UPI00103B33BA|nr:thrombospondin type-1 domain-containing protein 4-like [Ostrinia furnacalis]